MASTPIAMDYYNRRVTVPIGNSVPEIDIEDEVEILIKGKIKTIRAPEKPNENYKGSTGSPAEVTIEITAVTFEGKTNTFTKLSRSMDVCEDD